MGALTFAIGAVLLLTFLFNRTRLIDFEQHAAYLGALRQLGELDATLDKHVLEVRYGLLTHYDPLNKDLSELRETRARLAQFPALPFFTCPHMQYQQSQISSSTFRTCSAGCM